MDLEQLRTLLAAEEAGSLSAAARLRHLTQPAVSLQVKALEQELGASLFHRRGRGVEITEAGRALARQARRALAAVQAGRQEVEQIRGVTRGALRLGVTDAAATGVLPRTFMDFHRRFPGIEVAVEVNSTEPLLARLRDGRFDLVLGTLPVEAADVEVTPLAAERLGLVLPTSAKGVPLARVLAEEPFIAYPRGSITRRLIDAALAGAGLTARPVMEIGRPSVMARLVETGLGVSVLPEAVSTEPFRRGAVHCVPARRFTVERRLGLLRLRGASLEPAAQAFATLLLEPPPALAAPSGPR